MDYWTTWGPSVVLATTGVLVLVWRGLRLVFRIERALPTLFKIADEFQPNGGRSLKDNVTQLHDALDEHGRQDEERFARLEQAINAN